MSAVIGTVVSIKTMADGTPRITFDLQCSLSEIASLGVDPGTAYGLARLTQSATTEHAQKETAEPKGGELSKWAAMRCKEPEFAEFISQMYDRLMGGDGTGCGDVTPEDFLEGKEGCARHAILVLCGIDSRKELDTIPEAGAYFRRNIMEPWKKSPLNLHRLT